MNKTFFLFFATFLFILVSCGETDSSTTPNDKDNVVASDKDNLTDDSDSQTDHEPIADIEDIPDTDCDDEENDEDMVLDKKPNIYLYPEKKTDIDLSISFPLGGNVYKSIPEYGNGWSVTVEPDGTIDGKYGYLFYESTHPDHYQYGKGWVVKKENLEKFFRKNLKDYGFRGREIEDYIEWWIPRLTNSPYYEIYPQVKEDIEEMVVLNISVKPDSILRLYYVIRGIENGNRKIEKPGFPHFERNGFVLTEWGVVIR